MINTPRKKRSCERLNFNCLHCNKIFSVANHRKDSAKYCSRKCTALGTQIKYTTDCTICGISFEIIASRATKAKYCSRTCYYKGQTKKGTIKGTCIRCGKEYLTSPSKAVKRKFCSVNCNTKSTYSEWKPSFGSVRNYMKNRDMILKCQRCDYSEYPQILGVHHKDRNRKNNSLDNLEVLCPNCHSLEHTHHVCHGFTE